MDNIISFLVDLGAKAPENFETDPDLDEIQDFACDTLLKSVSWPSTKQRPNPADLISASDSGDDINHMPGPFPKRGVVTL